MQKKKKGITAMMSLVMWLGTTVPAWVKACALAWDVHVHWGVVGLQKSCALSPCLQPFPSSKEICRDCPLKAITDVTANQRVPFKNSKPWHPDQRPCRGLSSMHLETGELFTSQTPTSGSWSSLWTPEIQTCFPLPSLPLLAIPHPQDCLLTSGRAKLFETTEHVSQIPQL